MKEYSDAKWLAALWLDIFSIDLGFAGRKCKPIPRGFVLSSFDGISVYVSFDSRNREQRKTRRGKTDKREMGREIERERTSVEVKDTLEDTIDGKVTENDMLFRCTES